MLSPRLRLPRVRSSRALLVGLLTLVTADFVAAQSAPASSSAASADAPAQQSEAIVLSPFAVTSASDVGYAAGDSLAASRLRRG